LSNCRITDLPEEESGSIFWGRLRERKPKFGAIGTL